MRGESLRQYASDIAEPEELDRLRLITTSSVNEGSELVLNSVPLGVKENEASEDPAVDTLNKKVRFLLGDSSCNELGLLQLALNPLPEVEELITVTPSPAFPFTIAISQDSPLSAARRVVSNQVRITIKLAVSSWPCQKALKATVDIVPIIPIITTTTSTSTSVSPSMWDQFF
jgi:hypothetical protein